MKEVLSFGDAERAAGQLVGQPYLHPSLVALRDANLGRDDGYVGFEAECEGGCGL